MLSWHNRSIAAAAPPNKQQYASPAQMQYQSIHRRGIPLHAAQVNPLPHSLAADRSHTFPPTTPPHLDTLIGDACTPYQLPSWENRRVEGAALLKQNEAKPYRTSTLSHSISPVTPPPHRAESGTSAVPRTVAPLAFR